METNNKVYDCAIVGGGLAGLCLSIQLAHQGISVVLFERNSYPQHKVCGEYISMESWDFLSSLGVPMEELDLPKIDQLGVSAESGFMLESALPLGGFGVSRYTLDAKLCQLARRAGVDVLENCKVTEVSRLEKERRSEISTPLGLFSASFVCGSFGKYAPTFAKSSTATVPQGLNFVGVKYHITSDLAPNRIELHNFENGYCGVSKVDQEQYCLCYLVQASNLQAAGNDIKAMEARFLHKNPLLKRFFTESTFLYDKPLVISNVYFHAKAKQVNGILMLGDAAGAITPLCGNGMSMAMRASKILALLMIQYFKGELSEADLYQRYATAWDKNFKTRITAGQQLQYLFGKNRSTLLMLRTLHFFPALTTKLIKLTHGQPF